MASAWDWETNTRPFSTLDGEQPARFKLHQVDDDKFVLLTSFAFTGVMGGRSRWKSVACWNPCASASKSVSP